MVFYTHLHQIERIPCMVSILIARLLHGMTFTTIQSTFQIQHQAQTSTNARDTTVQCVKIFCKLRKKYFIKNVICTRLILSFFFVKPILRIIMHILHTTIAFDNQMADSINVIPSKRSFMSLDNILINSNNHIIQQLWCN